MNPDAYIGTVVGLLAIGAIGLLFTWLVEDEYNSGSVYPTFSIGWILKKLFQLALILPLVGLLVWSVKLLVLLVVS